MKKSKSKKIKFTSFLGVLLGIFTIIFGIIILEESSGSYVSSASFGADFYTYMYDAGKDAANNIYRLSEIVKMGFAGLLISVGGFEFLYFASHGKKEDVTPIISTTPVVEPTVGFVSEQSVEQ